MRIALFSGNYNYLKEGANQALNRLVGHLERRGHVFRIYSPVTDKPAFEPEGTLVPVPSIALPVRNEFRLALGLPGKIREDLRAFAPDIVHVSTPDILGSRAQTFAERQRLPVVASLHTRFETYPAYHGLGWLAPLAKAHLRRFYRRSDMVLCPTEALAEEMRAMRRDDKVRIWSRGVDKSLFNPSRRDPEWRRQMGIKDEEVVLLFFGRLVKEKGIDQFVETARTLRERGVALRPLAVGDGPARNLFAGLEGAILAGHLQGAELARAVASADVMLTPSTTETFGNVILEAMACGLPVVSADAANARAILEPGKTGLICPPTSAQAYADAIFGLIAQPNLRARMGEAALHASRAYSWEAASDSVADAYETLLEAQRAS